MAVTTTNDLLSDLLWEDDREEFNLFASPRQARRTDVTDQAPFERVITFAINDLRDRQIIDGAKLDALAKAWRLHLLDEHKTATVWPPPEIDAASSSSPLSPPPLLLPMSSATTTTTTTTSASIPTSSPTSNTFSFAASVDDEAEDAALYTPIPLPVHPPHDGKDEKSAASAAVAKQAESSTAVALFSAACTNGAMPIDIGEYHPYDVTKAAFCDELLTPLSSVQKTAPKLTVFEYAKQWIPNPEQLFDVNIVEDDVLTITDVNHIFCEVTTFPRREASRKCYQMTARNCFVVCGTTELFVRRLFFVLSF